MKLFGINSEETFKEYVETEFQAKYRESIPEDWFENNPHMSNCTIIIKARL